MIYMRTALLTSLFLSCPAALPEQQALNVSLVRLIANPAALSGKRVSVFGYLRLGERSLLFLHREDAEQRLVTNSIPLLPSEDMWRRKEKLDEMYVNLVGTFRTAPTENEQLVVVIKDVTSCSVWSTPTRPYRPQP